MKLKIAHLYPDLLNLYGDSGNVLCLEKRLEWRGIEYETDLIFANSRARLTDYDIIFIGGGQDFEQHLVMEALCRGTDEQLKKAVEEEAVVLAVCGGFQLLGRYYQTNKGDILNFTSILDFYTVGKTKRFIGNYIFKTEEKIRVIGFENHSGRTYLGKNTEPLGRVLLGNGNNGRDKTEGVRYKNVFGTYCHGPILPKNPDFADLLIEKALYRKYGKTELAPLDSSLEILARKQVRDLYI